MKKIISLILVCILALGLLSGCDRLPVPQETAVPQENEANFEPETTAVASRQQPQETALPAEPVETDIPADVPADVPQDATAEPAFTVNPTDVPAEVVPFSTPTPQPNTNITSYSEISGTSLGFKFEYPSEWTNIPGRSTVCYVQPIEDGTIYPARVAVTMKKMPHACDADEARSELVNYLKLLMTQYDEKTFKVSKEMDTKTKFMGKNGMSATYLAYDGDQEIKGYVILTYFERYIYCFHFLCAYEDYDAFNTAMTRMRESVKVEQS